MSSELIKEQSARMEKTRTWMVLYEPFFACLMFNLKLEPDEGQATMATDGRKILWNPDFAKSLSEPELRAVFLHEIMHCSALHMLRIEGRDMHWWNVACDFEVNLQLMSYYRSRANNVKLPAIALLDDRFAGKAAEVIYAELTKNKSLRDQLMRGKRLIGNFQQAEGGPAEKAALKEKWVQAVLQACSVCKERGDVPSFAQRLVDELLNPKQNWLTLLREFMYARVSRDYSWRKINRRYASSGFILPQLDSPSMGPIVICIDTSGSIDREMLDLFIGECEGIIRDCRPEKIHIISVDAAVHSEYELTPEEPLPRRYDGGGGTSFIPAFEWVRQKMEKDMDMPACLVYFTDAQGSFPNMPPEYPVFWAVTSSSPTPFGTRVEITTDV